MRLCEWITKVGIPARHICEVRGVPWQVCWAQARLESGRGSNVLAQANNFWGVQPRYRRDGTSITEHTHTVTKMTTEYGRDGKRRREKGTFCGWDSVEQGVHGYCSFVLRSRYAGAVEFVDDPLRWMAYVAGMGYATYRTDKYVRKFRKRLVWLALKVSRLAPVDDRQSLFDALMPPEIDEGLAMSLVHIGAENPGESRWAVTQFEAAVQFRRVPFEIIEFDDDEINPITGEAR